MYSAKLPPAVERTLPPGLFLLVMMIVAGTGVFFWLWPGVETQPSIDEDYFRERLERLSGADGADCGRLVVLTRRVGPYMLPQGAESPEPLASTGADPLACMRSAALTGRAFRGAIVSNPWGNHELLWLGLASDGEGGLWQVYFDPDVRGGWGPSRRPRMETRQCKALVFDPAGRSGYVRCEYGVASRANQAEPRQGPQS